MNEKENSNPFFSLHTACSKESGIILMNILTFFTLIIGGFISDGDHLHIGLRLWRYEISIQLHNHKTEDNQITIAKSEGE